MSSTDSDDSFTIEAREMAQYVSIPTLLPPLIRGQRIQSGPYIITVTDDMVRQRERENRILLETWAEEQRRRHNNSNDDDYVGEFKKDFVRRRFVKNVLCIVSLQLIFAVATVSCFMFIEDAQLFMIQNPYVWIIALAIFLVTYCAVSCSTCARRQPPNNWICLFLMTVAMAYLAAFVSIKYETQIVLLALSFTVFIVFVIALIATFSQWDLTKHSGIMLILGLIMMLAFITITIVLMFKYIKILALIISLLVALVMSLYLYYDIQTIMGGKCVELNPNEVVYAATQLYVDIVLLYQYVLMFMGLIQK